LLLFVMQGFHGRGIGRMLFEALLGNGEWNPGDKVTVNAAPGSAGFYGRLGFRAKEEWKVRSGIRYLAMERNVVLKDEWMKGK
jgi:GNAT superfamily N-acetyltransferase